MSYDQTFDSIWKKLVASTFTPELPLVSRYIKHLKSQGYQPDLIRPGALDLIRQLRSHEASDPFDDFLGSYGLDTNEGLAMMRLSEALLRIPDAETANALIHDILKDANWAEHLSGSDSALVKLSSAGLEFAKRLFSMGDIASMPADPVIRRILKIAVCRLGDHFVMGETIDRAVARSRKWTKEGYLFSYDMLGESARTETQAEQYLESYLSAISSLSLSTQSEQSLQQRTGISVKLSALHPHYEWQKKADVKQRLYDRLRTIMLAAKEADVPVTIDAEEARRLELSIDLLTMLCKDPDLQGFEGIGIAVQAYQKRAYSVIEYISALAESTNRKIPVRLVKGAYWDTEIKDAQVMGLEDYPVFTRKCHTDISYLACAYYMLECKESIYPQFATHNAHTIAAVIEAAGEQPFEFQMLHGMGDGIFKSLVSKHPCRIYAPVGHYPDLLAYLIRRLLENGANTSFVRQLKDESIAEEELCSDPLGRHVADSSLPIQNPKDIYHPERNNSRGLDTCYSSHATEMEEAISHHYPNPWQAYSQVSGKQTGDSAEAVYSPYDLSSKIGKISTCSIKDVAHAIEEANRAFNSHWQHSNASFRAECLENLANLYEKNRSQLIAICVKEAGKTIPDAIAEVREAIDFCHYYAAQAKQLFGTPKSLVSPTGEHNELSLCGRGVFACISPWNFPLAIFTGQVTAALAAGNAVIAKPAGQTPIIASYAVSLMLEAGIPKDVLHLVIGGGSTIGQAMIESPRIHGIVFTGSTATAQHIYQTRAAMENGIIPIIAETGGLNAMIADSSVLPEQTIDDIVMSAFGSAGQRCSALRVLYVQKDIEEQMLALLEGAMDELSVGSPELLSTDVGPVIDKASHASLSAHIAHMHNTARLIHATDMDVDASNGYFIAPHCFKVNSLADIGGEHFGPILHVISYDAKRLDHVITDINNAGYGLTCGIQTRILGKAEYLRKRLRIGNIYVNRNMIGATVGVQPFGGEGLSGTGPKAGGPHYLRQFTTERTYTVNTVAIGGNRDLLTQ
jgi:RHH-type proline utilization regulon transcriptional repressor/proline dehydrogenase/delta 1-pyrroline-5-carboxylate dehydrogenase